MEINNTASIISVSRTGKPVAWSALALAAFLCVFAAPTPAAKLYKWVDEDGSVRYSDRLPAQQSSKGHQQLNSQGIVLTIQEAAKSQEELEAEAKARRELEAEAREAARLKEIQDQKDRVLLLTFGSEEEIEHAHENRIEVIDSVIQLIQSNIETTQQKLEGMRNSAQRDYTSKGDEIPGGLAQKIEHAERKIELRNEQLQAKQLEREKITTKYEQDLERYRLLKSANKD